MWLENIASPTDLKTLSLKDLAVLCQELRQRIITVVAQNEGHLGSSLGTVELTVALHKHFDSPQDKIIWDVGHQAYSHKLLTGRNTDFETNRQWGGISGFPSRSESPHDAFGTGHAGTSISAALGMALSAQLLEKNEPHYIAVIGDASIASGMAFEALNHLGTTQTNVLVILNDNAQSIDSSVGALKSSFESMKAKTHVPSNLFQALQIPYHGPIDGHNLSTLLNELEKLKRQKGPRLLHVVTTKGKGLSEAEKDQVRYHAPGKFDPHTGKINKTSTEKKIKYQDVVGQCLTDLACQNDKIVAITPAMVTGSGLTDFFQRFPHRSFDVGIAEQHAVTLAAGMAVAGLQPFCVIYSTFLQRAYDQIIHDVALQKLPVVFCVDRAGLVGHDGPTHHGVFDIAFLRTLPNITLIAPSDTNTLRHALFTSQQKSEGPVAIRYPRGFVHETLAEVSYRELAWGKSRLLQKGKRFALVSVGPLKNLCQKALSGLENNKDWTHCDLLFIKPLDEELMTQLCKEHEHIVVVEDGVRMGGAGSALQEWAQKKGLQSPIHSLGIGDAFVAHGAMDQLQKDQGLDLDHLTAQLQQFF
ncbi:MAG: 1-deoxy-D-xylulose-5-phosphate synthase [Flavobacteriaceae bacterium]